MIYEIPITRYILLIPNSITNYNSAFAKARTQQTKSLDRTFVF
ncbi:hypothetical protein DDD_2717 [Nonlabens dokdonensis DSW-6]|uniref:Uncharacterized protein n=1 Tax=Nonlabens dokdonensis (strain DSM 17205 / KCTC 12402 / DSW-6) TaxID=592029 RepID=L7WCP8_NONDD|nr:hypothetical protein DDD_2717 [Nonlabens dokdonensis DSW-6]